MSRKVLSLTLAIIVALGIMAPAVVVQAADEQETYNMNLVGFMNWIIESDETTDKQKSDARYAMDVIVKAEGECFSEWAGGGSVNFSESRNDKITDLSDPNDAVNLRHMMTGLQIMKRVNELRQEDENFAFANMRDGRTSCYFMAVATTGAMRGAGLKRHSLLQVSCENLSFGTLRAAENWYYKEKERFDSIRDTKGFSQITSMEQVKSIEEYAKENRITIGHYTNLFYDADELMGVGYTPYSHTACYNASARSNYGSTQSYSVEEFEKLLAEYCSYLGIHDYDLDSEIEKATCTEDGLGLYKCVVCGYTTQKVIKAEGHKWSDSYTTDVEATCTEEGIESKHCIKCGISREGTQQAIPSPGHSYYDWGITEYPTCTKEGVREYICTRCRDIKTETVPKNDHVFSSWIITKEPTTEEEGVRGRYCYNCGYDEYESITKLPEQEPEIDDSTEKPIDTPEGETAGESTGDHGSTTLDNSGGNYPSDNPSDNPEVNNSADTPSDYPYQHEVDLANQTGSDGTALGEGASVQAAEAAIASMTSDNDLPGAVFNRLRLRSKKQTNTSISISWKKITGATSYVIYGNKCGKTNKLQRLAVSTGKSKRFTKVLGKKLKKGTYYKFMIVALDKNNNVVSSSKIIHVATKGGKVGNVGKVSTRAKKNKVSIKKGKTFKLAGKQTPAVKKLKVKKHRAVTYESTNPKIATVTKKGEVKAKKKGTCYIYAYAQNGVYKKIKIVVK